MKKKALLLTFSIVFLISTLILGLCACNKDDESGQEVTICQHEWVEVVQEGSLKSSATCNSQAVYYKSCSKCKINGTDTFKAGEYVSHTYAEGSDVCSICKRLKSETYTQYASTKGYYYSQNDNTLYFGTYPQTIVFDATTLSSLNKSAGALPTYTDFKSWKSYGYTEKDKLAEYMWYQDITLGNNKYRGVYFISYRPDKASNENTETFSNQDNNGYYTSNVYWFEFEPIKWNIVAKDGEEAVVISELALDAQYYNVDTSSMVSSIETIYASNYENSTIRKWLNDTFYKTAFSNLQQSLIINQLVDNSTTSDSLDNQHSINQKNTNDNIILLSYKDLSSFSFNKTKVVTSYAQSMGAFISSNDTNAYAKWWTRSASKSNGYSVYFVSYDGSLSTIEVDTTQISVVPSLKVRICTSDNPNGHEYTEVVDSSHLKSAATCISPAVYYKSCSFCGAHSGETFEVGSALGHKIVEFQDVKYLKSEATCKKSAVYYKSCSVCGEKMEDETFEVGIALGHDYSKEYDVDPTCEEKGYKAHECTRCGDVQKDNEKPALGHIMGEIVDPTHLKSAATCTSPAIYYKSCTRKGCSCNSEDTFEYGIKLGHDFVENVDPQYLKSAATCTSRAVYYKSCSRAGCNCQAEETFGYGNALGHVYDKNITEPTCCESGYTTYTCQRCTNSYVSDYVYALGHNFNENHKCTRENCSKIDVSDTYYINFDESCIYFGTYPQEQIDSLSLISLLNEKAGVVPTQTDPGKWKTYSNYYLNGKLAVYSWYIDVELVIKTGENSSFKEKYRGVYFINNRDNSVTGEKTLGEESYQEINGYEVNNVYWFRYDPIQWSIIDVTNGSIQIFPYLILDAQQYNSWTVNKSVEGSKFKESYPNDWETSDIRKWLNDTFYNTAFTSNEAKIIVDSEIANYRTYANSEYVTNDKIFLVSMSIIKTFKQQGKTDEDLLMMYGSDYALSQGLESYDDEGEKYGSYWARDPKRGNNYDNVNVIDVDGSSQYKKVSYSCIGVAPAMVITLKECSDGKHSYVERIVYPDCTNEGYTECYCKYCAYMIKKDYVSSNGHNYHDGICTSCGDIDYDEINALYETKGYALNNATLFFGKYPQTEISSGDSIYVDLCNQIKKIPSKEKAADWVEVTDLVGNVIAYKDKDGNLVAELDSDGNWTSYGWKSYGYYYYNSKTKTLDNTPYAWYYDIQYGGCWYRGVYLYAYKPNSTSEELNSSYNNVKENGFLLEHIYWFKYEPIMWWILANDGGCVTATTDLQIDALYYNRTKDNKTINTETVYAVDWENSSIRMWLNYVFYNTAFTNLEQTIILDTLLDNKSNEVVVEGGEEKYSSSQNNTIDKLYLPSLYDLTTSYDIFNADYRYEDYWRQNESSDYARIQGTYVYAGGDYDLNGYAYLRSPSGKDGYSVLITDFTGSIDSSTVDTVNGIVPMIRIKVADCITPTGEHDYSPDGICDTCGMIDETKFNSAISTKGYAVSNKYIYFGSYPQSLVIDSAISTFLNVNYPFDENSNDWKSYNYYINGSTDTAYMWYQDVTYGGVKYRGVYFKQYRQIDAAASTYSSFANCYDTNTVYWFKYEPIKWSIKNIENGKAYLAASTVLDSQFFDLNTNIFSNSHIKSWLNGSEFYDLVFSVADKSKLVETQGIYVSLPTSAINYSSWDIGATDYAVIQGLQTIDGYKKNNWLTQSFDENNQLYYFAYNKTKNMNVLTSGADISSTSYGIVPAIIFNYCSVVGHTWIDSIVGENVNRISVATCTSPAIYKKVCSCCGAVSDTETFASGEALGHDFKLTCDGNAKCQRSGCTHEEDFYNRENNTIKFGLYPQSVVTDADVLSLLNDNIGTPQTNSNWISYGYYSKGSTSENYMWYVERYIGNNKYRGVYLSKYRPTNCNIEALDSNSNVAAYGYSPSTIYWFKYEPIVWNIISEDDGQAILAANLMIDSQPYLDEVTTESTSYYNKKSGVPSGTYANDYSYSTIRQWLNDSFYNTAFSTTEKESIVISNVASDGYLTYDYVWICCSSDDYYETFKSNTYLSSNYAKIQGVSSNYMLRTYKQTSNGNIVGIDNSGNTQNTSASSTELGIIPIIKINISISHKYSESIINPTCTEQGYTLHKCTVCEHEYKDNYVKALGHTGGTATCTQQATCTRDGCGVKYGEALGHHLVDGMCDRDGCGYYELDKIIESMSAKGYAYCNKTLYFGYYPQSQFTNTSVIDELKKKTPNIIADWNVYKYYSNGTQTNYMYYFDVTYGDYTYRAIYIDSYRPNTSEKDTTTADNEGMVNNSYQNENGYDTKTTYWFIYEPIKWNVLSDKKGNLVVQSALVLDSQTYQNIIRKNNNEYYVYDLINDTYVKDSNGDNVYGTNWEKSSLREWLNNDFYNTAFNSTQKGIIQSAKNANNSTANQGSSSPYSAFQKDTNDNVYLAAYSDLINGLYGYNSANVSDANRQKTPTAYAKSQGVYVDNNLSTWWSRSANLSSIQSAIVSTSGSVMGGEEVISSSTGVAPMLTLNLCAVNHNYIEKVLNDNLKSEATCTEKAVYYKVCLHCGEVSSTEIFEYGELLAHTYKVVDSKDATCEEDGYINWECSICKATHNEIIPALGHIGGTATCTEKAICTRCNQAYGELKEHNLSFVEVVSAGCEDGYTIYKCVDCEEIIKTNIVKGTGHTGGVSTCQHKKICDVCYKEYGELAPHDYSITITIDKTCTTDGYQYHKCSVCDKVETNEDGTVKKYEEDSKTGHDYIQKLTPPYIKTKATCTACAVFYYACSKCGEKSTETYECDDPTYTSYYAKGHSYVNGVCSICGDKIIKRVNIDNKEDLTGDYILFGQYPQSKVTDSNTLLALNKKAKVDLANITGSVENWNDGVYYKYLDIICGGNKYRAIYLVSQRSAFSKADSNYSYNTIYWFKYEKIKWKILKQEDGQAMLQSTIVLDGQEVNTSVDYWVNSSLRTWLNRTFYNTAFVSSSYVDEFDNTHYYEQERLRAELLDNQTTSLDYTDNPLATDTNNNLNTSDKVYLLSYADYMISSYKDRILLPGTTDYAKVQSTYDGLYWTRSRSTNSVNSNHLYMEVVDNNVSSNDQAPYYVLSITPIITINLCEQHKYVDGRCSKCGDILYGTDKDADGAYVTFGSYPQSKVEDTTLIKIFNAMYPNPTTNTDWTLANATKYDGEDESFYFIDITHLGDRYRGIYYSKYKRTDLTGKDYDESHSYQDDNGYIVGTVYWFKYEDINWRMFATDEGETMIYADLVIDSRAYSKNSSNWANSALNKWLNDTFYNTAFSILELEILSSQFVDNKTTSKEECVKTETNIVEYVSLLSYADIATSSYRDLIKLKKNKCSDYAKALGYDCTNGEAGVWLRSTDSSGKAFTYNFYSGALAETTTSISAFGIVPVIKIQTCNHEYEFKAGSLICKNCRHKAYVQDEYTYNSKSYPLVTIGSYPTTLVSDSSMITKLNAMVTDPAKEKAGWVVGRTFNSVAHLWYQDVMLNDEKYRAVYFDGYIPNNMDPSISMSKENSYQDDNGYLINTIYWFKYTSIEWKLAYSTKVSTDDYYVLISSVALDEMSYSECDESAWLNCELYDWLITNMYNTLFTSAEKDLLGLIRGEEIGLISETEITNGLSTELTITATDYAKCQGAEIESGYTKWVTCTCGTTTVRFVTQAGIVEADMLYTNYSIVPIIMIKAN